MNFVQNLPTWLFAVRTASQGYEAYQSTIWNLQNNNQEKKLPLTVLNVALIVSAATDMLFLSLRIAGFSVSPKAEWAALVPRIVILYIANDLSRKMTFGNALQDLKGEQMFATCGKIVPSVLSLLSPRYGRYCNYLFTGIEIFARITFPLSPRK